MFVRRRKRKIRTRRERVLEPFESVVNGNRCVQISSKRHVVFCSKVFYFFFFLIFYFSFSRYAQVHFKNLRKLEEVF